MLMIKNLYVACGDTAVRKDCILSGERGLFVITKLSIYVITYKNT